MKVPDKQLMQIPSSAWALLVTLSIAVDGYKQLDSLHCYSKLAFWRLPVPYIQELQSRHCGTILMIPLSYLEGSESVIKNVKLKIIIKNRSTKEMKMDFLDCKAVITSASSLQQAYQWKYFRCEDKIVDYIISIKVKAFNSRYWWFTSCNFFIGYALSALNASNAASTPAICPCQITSYTNLRF